MERVAETSKQHEHSSPATSHAANAAAAPHSPLQELQQQAGNQAIQQLVRSRFLQPKLAISNPDDSEEREADQVAHTIMRSHAGAQVSSPCSCSGNGEVCEECHQKQSQPTISRSASAPSAPAYVPQIVSDVLRSPGHPLDSATRAFFEPRFDHDFSHVRIHTDTQAAASARSVNAHAYTAGPNIAFARGQYAPESSAGRTLLAHELAHVLQQERLPGVSTLARQPAAQVEPDPVESDTETEAETNGGNAGDRVFNIPPDAKPSNDNARTPANPNAPTVETEPDWRPDPNVGLPASPYRDVGAGTNWGASSDWNERQRQVANLRYQLERDPRPVMKPGGAPPDFVAIAEVTSYKVQPEDRFVWDELPEGSYVEYRPREFHIPDAMEHDLGLSNSEDEDIGLLLEYFPELNPAANAPRYAIIEHPAPLLPASFELKGKTYYPRLPRGAVIPRFNFNFDTVPFEDPINAFDDAEKKRGERRRLIAEREKARAAALAEPDPKKRRKRREDCAEDPCPHPLPILWPSNLPLPPQFRTLRRVSRGDREWEGIDRGTPQRNMAQEIAENRRRGIPPPDPCFRDDAEPNAPYDAHHVQPLYLGGADQEYNLCALRADRHQNGHPQLDNQTSQLLHPVWRACKICEGFLRNHPLGQEYEIEGRK